MVGWFWCERERRPLSRATPTTSQVGSLTPHRLPLWEPDPSQGHDGIGYRWYHLTDGTDRFYRPSPEKADASPNPDLKTGSGETHEGKETKEGVIKAGPLAIPWSKGNHRSGWLYLFRATKEIEVYPVQFERLEDCSGKLEAKRWVKLKKKTPNDKLTRRPGG